MDQPACLPGINVTNSRPKPKQNNVYNYESSQAFSFNSQTREEWEQGRYTRAQPKGILQNVSWASSDNSLAVPHWIHLSLFPRKLPVWVFSHPKFSKHKVSGEAGLWFYRIWSEYQSHWPLQYISYSQFIDSTLSPISSNPFTSSACNSDLAGQRSTSQFWKLFWEVADV